jgi:hypothetical protein
MKRSQKRLTANQSFRKLILGRAELLRPMRNEPIRLKLFNAYMVLLRRSLAHARVNVDETVSWPYFEEEILRSGMRELLRWLRPSWTHLTDAEREEQCQKGLDVYLVAGVPFQEAAGYVSSWGKKSSSGRAVTLRFAAISAAEERRRHLSRKWKLITERHCPCARPTHGVGCRTNLKREIRLLNAVLEKYTNAHTWRPSHDQFKKIFKVRPIQSAPPHVQEVFAELKRMRAHLPAKSQTPQKH